MLLNESVFLREVIDLAARDPLFQHTLVEVGRNKPELVAGKAFAKSAISDSWSGLPVVFDEVFTGLYRLGRFNCSSLVQAQPDIVVNAKLLTGGLIPLCTTTASQNIFEAFLSDEKADALLHGHSYTAHAVGCAVAVESLNTMIRMEKVGTWKSFQRSWGADEAGGLWSMWSKGFVTELSQKETIDCVFALGSVLALTVKDTAGVGEYSRFVLEPLPIAHDLLLGYYSLAAQDLHARLLQTSDRGWSIHSRVLGNVLYLMTSHVTSRETLESIEGLILESLG